MDATTPHKKRIWGQWGVRGQGLVEYALIMVSVAIVIIVVLTFIGEVVFTDMYSKISSGFPTPVP